MSLCVSDCSLKSANTGVPTGASPFGVPVSMFVVPLFAEDGTENQIDCSVDTLDQATIDAFINQADKTKRWYPIIGLENVESAKADNITETFNSGNLAIISEGVRNFTALLPSKTNEYLGQIKNLACGNIGVYLIDSCGNLLGNHRVDGYLKPMKVAQNTWSGILAWATDTTGQNITLTFNFDKTERDEQLKMIVASSITADLSNIDGLKDVSWIDSSSDIGSQSATASASTIYGGCQSPILVESFVLGDFTATLNGVSETLVSAPNVDGVYTFTITSTPVATDVLVVSTTKTGYEISDYTVVF